MKISKSIAKLQANIFTYKLFKKVMEVPFEDQFKYLISLGDPKDDIQRMLFKNKCQMRYNKFIDILFNLNSFLAYPFVLLYIYTKNPPIDKENIDLVYYDCNNFDEINPQQLFDEFPSRIKLEFKNRLLLKNSDIQFIFRAFIKYKLPFYLLLRFTLKLAIYRYIIEKYSPKAIAVTNEISPTSVAMTAYCEFNNVKHYNFMHGEKYQTINDSFIHFHRFYIYDEYYKELFLKLKADNTTNFILHKPYKFCIDIDKYRNVNKMVDFTYYLEEFDETEIRNISVSLDMLLVKGHNIRVRPHPRFCNYILLDKYINCQLLEDNISVSIYESIASCKIAVSLGSSILFQCYMLGLKVAIDDISDPSAFQNLIDKKYVMTVKPHLLLSELI